MKFTHTQVWGFEHAFRGMRNPLESWDRSDSRFNIPIYIDDYDSKWSEPYDVIPVEIGDKDLELAQRLIRAGSEHRKFMRQIFVSVDITAPLYWWKEFDTYKVGTTANSTSTMHKLASTPITEECFETDDYDRSLAPDDVSLNAVTLATIEHLESLRKKYLETKDQRYWKELIRWLPESWLQKRTVTMTYENIFAICQQRKNHKLNEWSGKDNPYNENFIGWAKTLPCANELIFLDEADTNIKRIAGESPKIICISGKAQHGKDTTAQCICESLTKKNCRVLILHYADLLKFLCTKLFGWNGEKDEYGRQLLQYVGTDVVRKRQPNYWVDFVIDLINLFHDEWDYVIIPDCRFPNEISRLKEAGLDAVHLRVVRDQFDNGLAEEAKTHASETALDNVTPDSWINNCGTIDDLQNNAEQWVEKFLLCQ